MASLNLGEQWSWLFYELVICFLRPPPPRHAGTLSGNSGGITAALRWFYAQTPRDFTSNLPDLKYPRETPGKFSKTKRSRGDCVQRILGAFLTSSDPTWLPERIAWRTLIYTSELILCSTICVHSATRHNIHKNKKTFFSLFHTRSFKIVTQHNTLVCSIM